MRLNPVKFSGAKPVDGYGPGFFRVGGVVYDGAVLCMGESVALWGGYGDIAALLALKDQVDVVFLGTGAQIAHPPETLRAAMAEIGIGVETMDSPTACRSYNVLLSEGRRVALAVLPV